MREAGLAATSTKASQTSNGPVASRGAKQETGELATLSALQSGGNQVFLSLIGRTGIQPKLRIGPVGDRFEQEADGAAAAVVRAAYGDGVGSAITLSTLPANASVQRKCAKCEEEDEEEEEEETIRRFPREAAVAESEDSAQPAATEPADASDVAASEPGTPQATDAAQPVTPGGGGSLPGADQAEPGAGGPPVLLLDDAADEAGPGQMRKTEFLKALRPAVCAAVDEGLAGTDRTSEGCPHVAYWFGYLADKAPSFIERGIRRFAPGAAEAQSAGDFIPLVADRVRQSTVAWARTGQITGVPTEFAGLVGSAEPANSGSEAPAERAIHFKARAGGARRPDDPASVRDELGSGRPLDGAVRARMESAYRADFGHVRIHTDAAGATLSDRFNARAFTVGEHVAFGAGEYRPGTLGGDALIAHELAHVLQQKNVQGGSSSERREENGIIEKDADSAALGAMARLTGRTASAFAAFAALAPPRMRSGLALSRCSNNRCASKKKAGVDSFVVTWATGTSFGPTNVSLRLDYTARFKKDATHDPAAAEFRQNVMTKMSVTAGPNAGATADTSPMHDDHYSRADDTSGNTINDQDFVSNDNPGMATTLDPTDVVDYSFTAEQLIIDVCDGNKVIARRGPHTGTVKGAHPRTAGGVPTTLS